MLVNVGPLGMLSSICLPWIRFNHWTNGAHSQGLVPFSRWIPSSASLVWLRETWGSRCGQGLLVGGVGLLAGCLVTWLVDVSGQRFIFEYHEKG